MLSFFQPKPKTYFVGHKHAKAHENYSGIMGKFGHGIDQRYALNEYVQSVNTYMNFWPTPQRSGGAFQDVEAARHLCLENAAEREGITLSDNLYEASGTLSFIILHKGYQTVMLEPEMKGVDTKAALSRIGLEKDVDMLENVIEHSLGTQKQAIGAVAFFNQQQSDIFDGIPSLMQDQAFGRFACKVNMLNEVTVELGRTHKFSKMSRYAHENDDFRNYEPKTYDRLLKAYKPMSFNDRLKQVLA